MEFFNTVMGKRFYEGTMPSIKTAIDDNNKKVADLTKTVQELKEQVSELTLALNTLSETLKWTR